MDTVDWSAEFVIQAIILGLAVNALYDWLKVKCRSLRIVNDKKTITQKVFNIIISYIIPLGVIVYMMIDNTMPTSFIKFGYFIITVVLLVFNLLMEHIITIYKMIGELTEKSNHNDKVHKSAINKLCEILKIPKAIN